MIDSSPPARRTATPLSPLLLLHAAGGACALLQVGLWLRLGRTLLGTTPVDAAINLALVSGGAAVGAFLAPRLLARPGASRRVDGLLLYACAQVALGLFGALVPELTTLELGAIGRGAALASLLVPSALCIGAVLPSIVAARSGAGRAARDGALLLAVNALAGGVALWWLASDGLTSLGAARLAVILAFAHLSIALLTMLVRHLGALASTTPSTSSTSTRAPDATIATLLLAAITFAGTASSGLVITWTELTVRLAGPSMQCMHLAVILHLALLALGAAVSTLASRSARHPGASLALLLVVASATVPLSSLAIEALPNAIPADTTSISGLLIEVGKAVALPSLSFGGIFAFAFAALERARVQAVHAVAWTSAALALGLWIGAFLFPLYLLPTIGHARSLLAAAFAFALAGAASSFAALRPVPGKPPMRRGVAFGLALASILATLALFLAPRAFDAPAWSRGGVARRDGPTDHLLSLLPRLMVPRAERVLHYADDPRVLRDAGEGSYELIVSGPSRVRGMSADDLYSAEAMTRARKALGARGAFALRIDTAGSGARTWGAIIATFLGVFPNATLWELAHGEDYVLIATRDGRGLDVARLAARVVEPTLARELAALGLGDALSVFTRWVADGGALRERFGDHEPIHARDASFEARAADDREAGGALSALEILSSLEVRAVDPLAERGVRAGRLGRRMVRLALEGREDRAIDAGEQAIGLAPDEPALRATLATLYLSRGKTHALVREDTQAIDALMSVLELEPPTATQVDALVTLADLDLRRGRARSALDRLERARRLMPRSDELDARITELRDGAPPRE